MRFSILVVFALLLAACESPTDGPEVRPSSLELVHFKDGPLPVRISNERELRSFRLTLSDSARIEWVTTTAVIPQDPDTVRVSVAYSRDGDRVFFLWNQEPIISDATWLDGSLYAVLSIPPTSGLAVFKPMR